MSTYREPAPSPPAPEVVLGPLALRAASLAPGIIFAVIASFLLLLAGSAIVAPSPRKMLRCSRAAGVLTCEDGTTRPGEAPRLIRGRADALRVTRLGGHSTSTCIELEGQSVCHGGRDLERLAALHDGESATMTESVSVMGIVTGGLFGLALAAMAGGYLWRAFGRRAAVRVRIHPRMLDVLSMSGRPRGAPIPRTPEEAVRVVMLPSRGRGSLPMFEIVYGVAETPLIRFTSFEGAPELEPHAARLRQALAQLPPAGGFRS